MLTLLTVLVLTQSAPVDASNACTKDSDCIITTTQCCGGCCGPTPYATTRVNEEKKKQRCAAVECAKPDCHLVCEPPASPAAFRAKCVQRECRMVSR